MLIFLAATVLPAADLSFTTPPGGQHTVSQLTGKVVALEFTYSTCQPCKTVSEWLKRLEDEFGKQGFEAYTVAFDPNARAMSGAGVIAAGPIAPELPLSWANARDVRNFLGYAASDRLSVPQIVLLDRTGQVRYRTGLNGTDPLRNDATLRARTVELLTPQAAPPATAEKQRKGRK